MDRLSRGAFLSGAASLIPAAAFAADVAPNAYVFCRPGGAQTAVGVFGHVGFAFNTGTFEYIVGSVENAHNVLTPNGKDFWYVQTSNPLERAAAWDNVGVGWQTRYDLFKRLTAPNPDPRAARSAIDQIRRWPFRAPGKDCLDAVRYVLHEYGVPMTHAQRYDIVGPNKFFRSLPAPAQALQAAWPGASVDASMYVQFDRLGTRDDLVLLGAPTIADDDISFDPTADTPQIAWSSVVVRRGMLALYSEPQFKGSVHVMRPFDFINSRDLIGWPSLGSFVLHDTDFDPADPPLGDIAMRFPNRAERSAYYDALNVKP